MIQLCHQIIHQDLRITYYKMSITEKNKKINNKIEPIKARYDLLRQIAKISGLSSGIVCKDILPEKDLFEKVATINIFEYLTLGKVLKAQSDIAKK